MKPSTSDIGKFVIILHGADEHGQPQQVFLQSYDPDGNNGQGEFSVTTKLEHAMKFVDSQAAINCWRMQSTVEPLRKDGKPNRPLSAVTVQVTPITAL